MRARTNLRAALRLASAMALVVAIGCDDDDDDDPGMDAATLEDAGGGGEDAGGGGEDAGGGGEDAGGEDAGTDGDAGMDGGAAADAGADGGLDAGADAGPDVAAVINEFAYAHNSSFEGGNAHEYIEIFGSPNTDYSHLTILYVNGNHPGSSGRIDHAIPVGTTDGDGFWLHSTPADEDVFANSSSTLLLVRDFTGAVLDDLDTDDDGMLDATLPFSAIIDSVGIRDADETDTVYSTTVLPRGFGGSGGNAAANSRIPNGVDTDDIADWVRNDGAGIGLPGGPTTASDGEGINTPGIENAIYTP